jgi:hypothetical protein
LAASICSAKNSRSALTCITALSITSPACSGALSLRSWVLPSWETNSIRKLQGDSMVVEFSLP